MERRVGFIQLRFEFSNLGVEFGVEFRVSGFGLADLGVERS